jgi:phosphoglycerate dehydrogenase-like enzyme
MFAIPLCLLLLSLQDEQALIQALKTPGKLKGAALDVFETEPLPTTSELWDMPNVLISPHNMDQTATFMHEATEFFLNENLPRFLCGEDLLNPVDPTLGY